MRRALALLIVWVPAPAAFATGEGETALTAGPGFALGFEDATRAGGSADARLLYGLTDSWSARLGLAGTWLASNGATSATRIVAPSLGVTAAADVLNLVPFAEAAVVFGDVRRSDMAARQYLGGELGAGVEYLVTRRLTVTLLGRLDYFALRLAGPDVARPVALTLALHLGRVFGP